MHWPLVGAWLRQLKHKHWRRALANGGAILVFGPGAVLSEKTAHSNLRWMT